MDFLLLSFRLLACQSNSILTSKDRHALVFFYVCFLSPIFPIHRTAGEGRGHLFNFSLPLPPASETLRHISRAITAENSGLHISSSWTRTGNFWFPSAIGPRLSYTKLSYLQFQSFGKIKTLKNVAFKETYCKSGLKGLCRVTHINLGYSDLILILRFLLTKQNYPNKAKLSQLATGEKSRNNSTK